METAFPLVTLQDARAPYKGSWHLVQRSPGHVEAIHSINHPRHRLSCVIERRSFASIQPAQDFTGHLLCHGWGIQELHESGEHFWFRLAERVRAC